LELLDEAQAARENGESENLKSRKLIISTIK
jgi:hypothetical protein